jgi:two-component system, cell cycle response regulator DivK
MAHEPILVVDDSPLNLKLVRVILQGEGYDVHTAADAEEAMRVMQTFRPRVILTDLRLPGEDGLDLTRRLKSQATTKDIVILAVTGCVLEGDEARALAAGCDGYITKPFDIASLKQVIARHLAKATGKS